MKPAITLHLNGELIDVPLNNIIRIEADHNYTQFYLIDRNKLRYAHTLKYLETKFIHTSFIRVHDSHFINKKHIRQYDYYNDKNFIQMMDGIIVPIARTKLNFFLKKLKCKRIFFQRENCHIVNLA